jgi:hypothetical protein
MRRAARHARRSRHHKRNGTIKDNSEDIMSSLKPLTGAFVRAANETYGGIALNETRPDELTIELSQLRAAIETVRAPIAFDSEPADFRAALVALSKGSGQ